MVFYIALWDLDLGWNWSKYLIEREDLWLCHILFQETTLASPISMEVHPEM